ncbi:MAG: hypothetical protein Pg6C_13450 [Treponemataceae bacterium]|nr:MAG: hypothetical protein Pg6C_13450 [Treponemataceae bacterium]
MKKISVILMLAPVFCFSFRWPQDNVQLQSFSLGFSELRESIMSQSLIFAHNDQIKAVENGTVVAVIRAPDSDSSLFCSTLGNAVIVNHGDTLVAVYGNLDEISLAPDTDKVTDETIIGRSGTSGWIRGHQGLEFQMLDIKNKKALNPRSLMPRFETELPLYIPWVFAVNSKNEIFSLGAYTKLPAGQYKLYVRGDHGVPYKTAVLVDVAVYETIVYDALSTSGAKLTVQGRSAYATRDIYPGAFDTITQDKTLLYLSTVLLSSGKKTIRVILSDINNTERQSSFTVDVN